MNTELKNCPFCDNKAECVVTTEPTVKIKVFCKNCGMTLSESLAKEISVEYIQARANALMSKWNQRAGAHCHYWQKGTTDNLKYDYSQDNVIISVTDGSIVFDREELTTALEDFAKQSKEGEWTETAEGFRCSKCKAESRYRFVHCANCNAYMRNASERF